LCHGLKSIGGRSIYFQHVQLCKWGRLRSSVQDQGSWCFKSNVRRTHSKDQNPEATKTEFLISRIGGPGRKREKEPAVPPKIYERENEVRVEQSRMEAYLTGRLETGPRTNAANRKGSGQYDCEQPLFQGDLPRKRAKQD
jgi:hypothetical protein